MKHIPERNRDRLASIASESKKLVNGGLHGGWIGRPESLLLRSRALALNILLLVAGGCCDPVVSCLVLGNHMV